MFCASDSPLAGSVDNNPPSQPTQVRFVTCGDLSSLSTVGCLCSHNTPAVVTTLGCYGSSRRKRPSRPASYLFDLENISPLTARRLAKIRPSCVDKLILENRIALEEMEGRRSVGKVSNQQIPTKPLKTGKGPLKRKRAESLPANGATPAVKRLKSIKGSESDSSPSRNTSAERKPTPTTNDKTTNKLPNINNISNKEKTVNTQKKVIRKFGKGKSRFSTRIVLSSTSLRSGKKRTELLNRKKTRGSVKDSKNKKSSIDKTDSNSNVFTENESNDETVYNSTDSEVSRTPPEFTESVEKDKNQDVSNKKKKKRRKRDSMWVKKIKKQIKDKPESTDKPPALEAFGQSNSLNESTLAAVSIDDLPVLDKASDDSSTADSSMRKASLDSNIPDDVSMPMLEKEVELPIGNSSASDAKCDDVLSAASDTVMISPNVEENPESLIVPAKPPVPLMSDIKSEIVTTRELKKSPALGTPHRPITPDIEAATELETSDLQELETSDLQEPETTDFQEPETKPLTQDENQICLNDMDMINKCDSADLETKIAVHAEKIETSLSSETLVNGQTCVHIKEEVICDKNHENSSDFIEIENHDIKKEPQRPSNGDISEETVVDFDGNVEKSEDFLSSARHLEDEITKLEEVLSEKKDVATEKCAMVEQSVQNDDCSILNFPNCESDSKDVCQGSVSDSTNTVPCAQHTEDVSLLAADSTSDVVKPPQSLDDSFSNFSLSFPEDLNESSPSDLDRDEREVLPDSTEPEEEPRKEDETPLEVLKESDPDEMAEVPLTNELHSEIEDANLEENKMDVDDVSLKQDFSTPQPLAGSTPQKTPPQEIFEPTEPPVKKEVLTLEERRMKESVLQAVGLKSLSPVPPPPPASGGGPQPSTGGQDEKPKRGDGYTGTLKAVIKLNRSGDKKRMVYQRSEDTGGALEYRICSEAPVTEGVPITHLNDIAGLRKTHKFQHGSDSQLESGGATSNGHCDDPEVASNDESINPSGKDLIIPEKSSSFSIHPGRLCSDVCTYCFGKFGCLDTPCHVAALKPDRQKKILEHEPHLTGESCLCDACYRYVDRRANCPSKSSSSSASKRVKPASTSICCVNGCTQQATHTVKKKWLVKLKRSITNKLDMDLDKPGAMYYPLCAQHHYWVDYFTFCGICRKRLNRNHLYSLGAETDRLNLMLAEDGIPARLSDKLFLCKLCRYYSNLRLKYSEPGAMPAGSQVFYRDYRRKILTSLDIPFSDSEEEAAPLTAAEKKKTAGGGATVGGGGGVKKEVAGGGGGGAGGGNSSGGGGGKNQDESVRTLTNLAALLGDQPEQQQPRIQVKFGNVNIGRLSNLNIGQGSRGEEPRVPYSEVNLQANLEFEGSSVQESNWERCVSTIQFDKRTKKLWQDLQKPYGNQSSFLRHMVMLEKYWREGHLTLTPNADERVAKYLNGVKNRIKAFEGNSGTSSSVTIEKQTPVVEKQTPVASAPSVSTDKFPLMMNTGEIEVTPINVSPKRPPSQPVVTVAPAEKRPLTALDRAKALVRMVPPAQRSNRFPMPLHRYQSQFPMYHPSYNYPVQQSQMQQPPRPPPLLKIGGVAGKAGGYLASPSAYYQQHVQIQRLPQPVAPPPPPPPRRPPVLPRGLPSALTVTQVAHGGGAAITLNRSGITIEKQSGTAPLLPTLPMEKPSISVFREPAPGHQ